MAVRCLAFINLLRALSSFTALVFLGCLETEHGKETIPNQEPVPVSSLLISEDATAWTERDNGFYEFADQAALAAMINGGADQYTNAGMIEGFRQKMVQEDISGNKYFEAMVMDFGNSAAAFQMYTLKTDELSGLVTIGAHPLSAIAGKKFLGGISAFGHIHNIYFENSVSGFRDQAAAINTMEQIIGLYQQAVLKQRNN